VPPILVALAKHPLVDKYDLSSLEGIMSGAAPLGGELAQAVEERLGCVVGQGYGLTETSPVTHTAPNQRKGQTPYDSIGPASPTRRSRSSTRRPARSSVPATAARSGSAARRSCQGYFGQPGATAATIDDEGWLHTGDIGTVDEHGLCRIVDRVKELIKYKGFQVAPAELEAAAPQTPLDQGRRRGTAAPTRRPGRCPRPSSSPTGLSRRRR
jgi:acyl-CoA synthetase (AMP-forming)/AMP-acid ligase II